MEIATLLTLIWCLYPLFYYNTLTNTAIPIHYDFNGETNAWGSRSFLLFLPLLSLVMYIGMSAIEKYYPKFNFPIEVTPKNADALYRLGLNLLRCEKFFIIFLFAYINNASISNEEGLNGYIILAIFAGMVVLLFIYLFKMLRLKDKSNRITN